MSASSFLYMPNLSMTKESTNLSKIANPLAPWNMYEIYQTFLLKCPPPPPFSILTSVTSKIKIICLPFPLFCVWSVVKLVKTSLRSAQRTIPQRPFRDRVFLAAQWTRKQFKYICTENWYICTEMKVVKLYSKQVHLHWNESCETGAVCISSTLAHWLCVDRPGWIGPHPHPQYCAIHGLKNNGCSVFHDLACTKVTISKDDSDDSGIPHKNC